MLNSQTICTCSVFGRQKRYDPTKTTTLRNAFAAAMRKRFRFLCSAIVQKVDKEDCFGLRDPAHRITLLSGEFVFSTTAQKVDAFMAWLRQMEEVEGSIKTKTLSTQLGASLNPIWANKYLLDSYERGVSRAQQELKAAGFDIPDLRVVGGMKTLLSTPMHLDRLGILYSRAFTELKGITEAMDKQLSIILTKGLMDGVGPRQIATLLTRTITGPDGDLGITDSIGRYIPAARRAEMLARTEIIRAHHIATVQEYKNWGAAGVKVEVEWQTAGYNVCPQCSRLSGKVFTLTEIETMIPAHPNCRCCAVPVVVARG